MAGLQSPPERSQRRHANLYVTCDLHKHPHRVIGFYSLAASAVERRRLPSRVARSMPEPLPVILLGQLAVDTDYQGRGLGSALLIDALRRSYSAAQLIGVRAVTVQTVDQSAQEFYNRFGFRTFSDREPLMLVLRISEVRSFLQR